MLRKLKELIKRQNNLTIRITQNYQVPGSVPRYLVTLKPTEGSALYDTRLPVQWRFAPHGEGSLKGVKFAGV